MRVCWIAHLHRVIMLCCTGVSLLRALAFDGVGARRRGALLVRRRKSWDLAARNAAEAPQRLDTRVLGGEPATKRSHFIAHQNLHIVNPVHCDLRSFRRRRT